MTVEVLHAPLVRHGADLLEVGMPFSDPMADGPVIQQANERALARHVGLTHVLDSVRQFRTADVATPIILMGYLNPIERFGFVAFAEAAGAAGVDGMLLVDCPIEESGDYEHYAEAPGTEADIPAGADHAAERRQRIAAKASGFLSTTFRSRASPVPGIWNRAARSAALDELRGLSQVPIAVGFGIKRRRQGAADTWAPTPRQSSSAVRWSSDWPARRTPTRSTRPCGIIPASNPGRPARPVGCGERSEPHQLRLLLPEIARWRLPVTPLPFDLPTH